MSGIHVVGHVCDYDGHRITVGVEQHLTVVRSVGARLTPDQLTEFAHLVSVAGRIAYANAEQMAAGDAARAGAQEGGPGPEPSGATGQGHPAGGAS